MPHITRLAGSYIQYNDGTQEPLPIPQEEDGMYHQVRAFLDAIAGRLDTAKPTKHPWTKPLSWRKPGSKQESISLPMMPVD